jgi:hypothetical protein
MATDEDVGIVKEPDGWHGDTCRLRRLPRGWNVQSELKRHVIGEKEHVRDKHLSCFIKVKAHDVQSR